MKTQLRKIVLALFFTCSSIILFSQTNQWTWMSGTNKLNDAGNFGKPGVTDTVNMPGARAFSITWSDLTGNLWLFGGEAFFISTKKYFMNDLWKYDIKTNLWTWMSGSNVPVYGRYGSRGISIATNKPGARYKSVSWTDKSGNLWLFGGYGVDSIKAGVLNDLWKYNISTNQWTWMSGADTTGQLGNYGQKGVAAASNVPGAREGALSWTDKDGNFWLFGGRLGESISKSDYLNDLWKYNPATNLWTWMNGSDSVNKDGVYGTKGIADSFNTPGARANSFSWVDRIGNLWLFGGAPQGAFSLYNDLWKYNINTNQWSWESGSNLTNQFGNYGTKGIEADSCMPDPRELGASFIDADGNLRLLGGYRMQARYNDMWRYNLKTKQWMWMAGMNPTDPTSGTKAGVYGTKGVVDSTNKPGSRRVAASWTDTDGNYWLFGGDGFDTQTSTTGYLNDLWKYTMVIPTSTAEIKTPLPSTIILYPNPASSVLTVKSEKALGSITIKDVIGRTVYSLHSSNSIATINIEILKAGIYFVESGVEEKNIQRFIKE